MHADLQRARPHDHPDVLALIDDCCTTGVRRMHAIASQLEPFEHQVREAFQTMVGPDKSNPALNFTYARAVDRYDTALHSFVREISILVRIPPDEVLVKVGGRFRASIAIREMAWSLLP